MNYMKASYILIISLALIVFLMGILLVKAYAETTFNDEITQKPIPLNVTHDHIVLICSTPSRVIQGYQLMYIIKVLDTKTVTKYTTPYEMFIGNQGDLNNVLVNVTLSDYKHEKLFKWTGKTNEFGLFVGSLRLLNYPTNQIYYLTFSAEKQGMYNYTTWTYFELYDARSISH